MQPALTATERVQQQLWDNVQDVIPKMSTERAILGKDRHGTSEGCLWHILCSVLKVPQEAFYVRMPKKPLSAEQPRIYQCCHATMKADVLRSSEYKFRAWRDSHGW